MKLGVLTSHPIQYQAPIFRELAKITDLQVFFAHQPSPAEHAAEEFGVEFSWDRDLTAGYDHVFLVNVAQRPGFNRFFGCNTPEIERTIRVGRFDAFLLMGWNLLSHWQAYRTCKRTKVPVMVRGDSQLGTPRGSVKRILKKPVYRRFLRSFDACLFVGQRSREYYQHYSVDANKLFFSPHAVDNEWFSLQSVNCCKRRQRRVLGLSDTAKIVLFVGKLATHKRPLDPIAAIRHLDRNVELVYVGSGEQERRIRQFAHAVNRTVHMLGFKNQSEMPKMYCIADVIVLPSESETWGMVVNEAMCCGLPAIVSDAVGCGPDLIDEGRTGSIYPSGDTRAMARCIKKILDAQDGDLFREATREKIRHYSPRAAAEGIAVAARAAS